MSDISQGFKDPVVKGRFIAEKGEQGIQREVLIRTGNFFNNLTILFAPDNLLIAHNNLLLVLRVLILGAYMLSGGYLFTMT